MLKASALHKKSLQFLLADFSDPDWIIFKHFYR